MLTQGEAVFQAVVEVMGKKESGAYNPSQEQLDAIRERVIARFQSGETSHSKNPSQEELRRYVPGLVNNWLRKDLRLNGGSPYVPKNPGSRRRSSGHNVAQPQVRRQQVQANPPRTADEPDDEADVQPATPSASRAVQTLMEIDKKLAALRSLVIRDAAARAAAAAGNGKHH